MSAGLAHTVFVCLTFACYMQNSVGPLSISLAEALVHYALYCDFFVPFPPITVLSKLSRCASKPFALCFQNLSRCASKPVTLCFKTRHAVLQKPSRCAFKNPRAVLQNLSHCAPKPLALCFKSSVAALCTEYGSRGGVRLAG